MATKAINRPVEIEQIICEVTCPECQTTFKVQMRDPRTRKNCRCNNGTFLFGIMPFKGGIKITVVFTGADWVPVEYQLKSTDIEISEE